MKSTLCSVRSAAQTTYGDDIFPSAIVVTYPPHPLVGTTLKVVGHRHQGKELLWRAMLPDGSRVDLPAVWTDRSKGVSRSIQPRGQELRTTPLVLRELTALLETLVAAPLSCKARTQTLRAGANDGNPTWVQRVWLSIPTAVRQEILALLAPMARAVIGGRQPAEGDKEVSDE